MEKSLLLVLILYATNIAKSESIASFQGNEYIQYKITDAPIQSRKDKVTLKFKTTEAYGVLLYSCGEQGDFLLLEIKRGKIVYTGDFGSTIEQSGAHQIILDKQYNDDKWHQITLLRVNGTHVYLTVDDVTQSRDNKLDFEQLNLDTYLYVGGFGNSQRLNRNCHSNVDKKNFIGCLANVRFNSIDLLYGAIEKFTTFKTYGQLSFTCPTHSYEIFGFHAETSIVKVKRNILNKNELNFAIELRTFEPKGHIATHLCTNGGVDLDLIEGKVRITLSFLGLVANDAIRLDSPEKIDDGDWHTVHVIIKRNESSIDLIVDNKITLYRFQSHFKLAHELGLFMSTIRFGGNTPNLPGLVSCFRKLVINTKTIDYNSKDIAYNRDVKNQCQIKDLCFPNPCQHGSTCTQSRQQMYCNCKNTDYQGERCESCIHKRTCQEIKESGEKVSGTYKICPKNERIFRVFCNMETGGTVIRHNTKNDTLVGDGTEIGSSTVSFYFHNIQYFIQKEAIRDLISVSMKCEQYIRYDCYHSRLLFDVGSQRYAHFKGARWVSRDSEIQQYWGGATPKSRKCGCGMDGSCAKDSNGNVKDCNCDVGDRKWRFDAGMLRDKSTLPISQVQFSKGPETEKISFFSVGELKCFGTIPKPTKKPSKTVMIGTIGNFIQPSYIDSSMFYNTTKQNKTYKDSSNKTILTEKVQAGSIDSLFSKPWLITIVVVGAMLCLLLVFLVFLLFRQHIHDVLMKCLYGKHIGKPRIEIEDYNRYSTATEDQSDWDIYRLSTTFPTSTPEPSYGPTDDESAVGMRVRTLEDLRGKRRFKRLTGWGSRTASAPTVVGVGSKQSLNDKYENFTYQKENTSASESSQAYHSSIDSNSNNRNLKRSDSLVSDTAYSTTATDGEADSVLDTNSEFSHPSQASSMKESECSPKNSSKYYSDNNSDKSDCKRPNKLCINGDKCSTGNGVQKPQKNGSAVYGEPVKAYYPLVPVNGYRQPVVRRAHPVEYGTHVQMLNNNGGRCQLPNGPVTRLVSINRQSSGNPESYPLYTHPTIQERPEELSDDENEVIAYENARNSDGFYELYDQEQDSPSSETRLLFDDASSREECEREADEQIKLLKKKVIEKATSADECA